MILLRFSPPPASAPLAAIEQLAGRSVAHVVDVETQFDHNQPFTEQAQALVDGIGLSSE